MPSPTSHGCIASAIRSAAFEIKITSRISRLIGNHEPHRYSGFIRAAIELNHHNPELWEPENVEHCGALDTYPIEYQRRVLSWFSTHDVQRQVPAL